MANRRTSTRKSDGSMLWIWGLLIVIAMITVSVFIYLKSSGNTKRADKGGEEASTQAPQSEKMVAGEKQNAVATTVPGDFQKPAEVPARPETKPHSVTMPQFAFQSVGLGGGGGIYTPAISPVNPYRMFVSCDMGGFYYSWNMGRQWRMIDFRQMDSVIMCKPVWHPFDELTAYAYGGTIYKQVVKVTHDGGVTWKPVCDNQPWGGDGSVVCLGLDRKNPSLMLVGAKKRGETPGGVFVSVNEGRAWRRCSEVSGIPVGFHVDVTTPLEKRRIFAGTSEGVWRSDDGGTSWRKKVKGLPSTEIRNIAGGEKPDGSKSVLFVTVPSRDAGGKFEGGIYRSDDYGETWTSVMSEGTNTRIGKVDQYGAGEIAQYKYIAMPQNQTDIVYVTAQGTGYYPPNHSTMYKTSDSGKTWHYCFNGDPRFKEKNIELAWYAVEHVWTADFTGISAADSDPDHVLATLGDKIFMTTDGGKSWNQLISRRVPGTNVKRRIGPEWKGPKWAWSSIGVETMTCWDYVVDPTNSNRHYICYTDSGFTRSLDGGKSWSRSIDGSPWVNTWYGIVCDPKRPGTIYAACSNTHDIPHSTHTAENMSREPGGVCISTDYGETWKPISEGIPKKPVTSIVMDPTSPPDSRTLYVTVIDAGVYKSTDGGKTWAKKSEGLGSSRIMRPYIIKRYHDGTLYCSVTCYRNEGNFPTDGPGLYMSTDGAEHWTCISKSLSLGWPVGFAVDATDKNVVYLAASSGWSCRSGGLYKTTDGGENWRQLFNNETPGWGHRSLGGLFVKIKPDDPKIIYFSTSSHGLWLSKDAGESFQYLKGIPFKDIHRIVFDPADSKMMYVTTFGGGVWHGPAEGVE